MKKYIILTAMLVITFGLSAQRTNSNSRTEKRTTSTSNSDEKEKKTTPSVQDSRTKDATPVRQSNSTETKKEIPVRTTPTERQTEPRYNESRNRERTPVNAVDPPRRTEQPRTENRPASSGNTRQGSNTRENGVQHPTGGNKETQRKSGGAVATGRPSNQGNNGNSRYENGNRPNVNSREANNGRSREYVPRTGQEYTARRQAYRTPDRPRIVRSAQHSTTYVHQPVEYRRNYYPYSEPRRVEIIWDVHMYNEYRYLYPHYDYWYYPYGYRIQTVSAYDADRYIGEVARIFGRVSDVFYERQTDEYTLYFGEPYPYQDFSVIISGKQARRFSYRPERYFMNRNVTVTGLVSLWDGRPEMVIKKRSQVDLYF